MNSVGREFKNILPKLLVNIALAVVFGTTGVFSSIALTNVAEDVGFYSWLVFTVVGAAFLVRALFGVLIVGDKTVSIFMKRTGIQQPFSRRRIAKDLICVIAITLATAAILPFFETLDTTGTVLQSITAIVAVGASFLFFYDITRTIYLILHDKARAVENWLAHKQGDEAE